MTEPLRTKIAEFVESLLTLDSWDPTPEEAADHVLKLVAEHQPARRVFFPGDTVPADVSLLAYLDSADGPTPCLFEPSNVDRVQAKYHGIGLEITVPSMADWEAAVDWARAEREQSTTDTEHADDCTGCDGPGIVPCAADRVIGNTAYRNGQPIKNLAADHG